MARLLKVSEGEARRLVYALQALGYVEVAARAEPPLFRGTRASK